MTFVARSVRYVLRKRVRTIVLLIVLTIITAILRTSAGRTMPPPRGVSMLPCRLLASTNPPTASFSIRPAAC